MLTTFLPAKCKCVQKLNLGTSQQTTFDERIRLCVNIVMTDSHFALRFHDDAVRGRKSCDLHAHVLFIFRGIGLCFGVLQAFVVVLSQFN